MTVGIATICQHQDDPRAVIAADRMVTVGDQSGIEYEDTESKLEPFYETEELTAVAVGAGSSTYIDEIFRTLNAFVNSPGKKLTKRQEAMQLGLLAYQNTVRETINNQVFEPFGYTIDDLKDQDTEIPATVQKGMVEQVQAIKQRAGKNVQILIAAVGMDGAGIYHLSGMDYTNFTDIGYSVVGSGSDSARLSFIRREYDRQCNYAEGLFTVLEAKSQAEERQGVGQRMDLMSIEQGNIHRFDENEKDDLRERLDEIDTEERKARERVMDSWTIE